MNKIKYLILIAIISFFVLPSNINASAPATIYEVVSYCGGFGCYQVNELERGKEYEFRIIKTSGFLRELEFEYKFDKDIFEAGKPLGNVEYRQEKLIIPSEDLVDKNFSPVASITVKVKENAKLGKINAGVGTYEIVCSGEQINNKIAECVQDIVQKPDAENDNNQTEENKLVALTVNLDGGKTTQKFNDKYEEGTIIELENPTKEGYTFIGWTIANENKLIIEKDDVVIKALWSKVNLSNNDKNNNENSEANNKAVLNDKKFYVLSGLLGTVVIEMFVLILKKTKKA